MSHGGTALCALDWAVGVRFSGLLLTAWTNIIQSLPSMYNLPPLVQSDYLMCESWRGCNVAPDALERRVGTPIGFHRLPEAKS